MDFFRGIQLEQKRPANTDGTPTYCIANDASVLQHFLIAAPLLSIEDITSLIGVKKDQGIVTIGSTPVTS